MRVFLFWCAVCDADCGACGRDLNAKETPDGFLSHYLPFRKYRSLSNRKKLKGEMRRGAARIEFVGSADLWAYFGI